MPRVAFTENMVHRMHATRVPEASTSVRHHDDHYNMRMNMYHLKYDHLVQYIESMFAEQCERNNLDPVKDGWKVWSNTEFRARMNHLFKDAPLRSKLAYLMQFGFPVIRRNINFDSYLPEALIQSEIENLRHGIIHQYSAYFTEEMSNADFEERYVFQHFSQDSNYEANASLVENFKESEITSEYRGRDPISCFALQAFEPFSPLIMKSQEGSSSGMIKTNFSFMQSKLEAFRSLQNVRIYAKTSFEYGRLNSYPYTGLRTEPQMFFGEVYSGQFKEVTRYPVSSPAASVIIKFFEPVFDMKEVFNFMNYVLYFYGSEKLQQQCQICDTIEMRRAKLLSKRITKDVTDAVHLGCPKIVITDYNSILFMELDCKLRKVKVAQEESPCYVGCKFKLMHCTERYSRLYLTSFSLSDSLTLSELAQFRGSVKIELDERAVSLLKRNSQIQRVESGLALPDDSFRAFKEAFTYVYYVKLGRITERYVQFGHSKFSQVAIVNAWNFLEDTHFGSIYHRKKVTDYALLKVMDPFWAERKGEGLDSDYDRNFSAGVDCYFRELSFYELLNPLMGGLIPFVFSYGNLIDVDSQPGNAYLRLTGPYILMEYIDGTTVDDVSVSLQFVVTQIIPAFETLHSFGVVHNNVHASHIMITNDHKVKLINFRRALYTTDTDLFDKEIREVMGLFELNH